MATHSNTLAWKIPWMVEPGRLQSMGLQSWTRLSNFTSLISLTSYFITGEGNGNPLQVFLPGESHGQRSLAGHGPWSCRELDTTEVIEHACKGDRL